ncbi:hypothetical protein [Rhizobium sp. MHM7A]|uniref:hypothetical protein n=1 Tax=Rhizobium sp. MHM7A TaxID=2583233 RepID=UPI001105E8A7|nr:hypothetical protein [Rhizobium sp. MHM7A]TLX15955.1 hypothetical protein FFR93_01165 [Rhizobium sp. MHM7A]
MSSIELTHEIMRKLTAAFAKVDSGNLRQFERINLVAEAFGWKGDALMHHLKKGRSRAVPTSDDGPGSGSDGPGSGSIDLFVGPSTATRSAYVGVRAASLSEKHGLPVYCAPNVWRVRDRLLPAGIVMSSLGTIDDWNEAVKLARMGNRVLVDARRIANDLATVLPLLGAKPEEMALVSSIVSVAEHLGEGRKVYSTFERLFPFKLE